MNRGPWRATVCGVTKESDTTEHRHTCVPTDTQTHREVRLLMLHGAAKKKKKKQRKDKIQRKRKVTQAGDKRIPKKRKMPLNT